MVRSTYIDENGMKKGAWSKEEDNKLKVYINRYGHWNWRELPKYAGLSRCGKSCRLRWLNYLKPNVKRGSYTTEEEDIIMKLHDQLGKKWSVIAKQLPGRTDNEVKNYWHTYLKKRTKLVQNPILSSSKEMGESSSSDCCQFEGNQENSCNQSSQILKENTNQEMERESFSYNIPLDHKKSTSSDEGLTSSEASSSCSDLSLSYSDAPLSDLMTWVGEDSFTSFESLANFMSPPLTDPGFLYSPSPIIEEEFLWSYHLGDESNINW